LLFVSESVFSVSLMAKSVTLHPASQRSPYPNRQSCAF
jgi:hypothetical protein